MAAPTDYYVAALAQQVDAVVECLTRLGFAPVAGGLLHSRLDVFVLDVPTEQVAGGFLQLKAHVIERLIRKVIFIIGRSSAR